MKKIWYAPNQFDAYGKEEIEAVVDSLRSGWLAPGPITDRFEKQVAKFFAKKYGVFVNSGSSANAIALRLAGVKAGDEVITPSCTFATTVAPIVQMGAIPIFIDVITGRYVSSPEQVLAAITPKTKAIMLPNLIGNKPDWATIREFTKLPLIEDSCDIMATTQETDFATTSFYASHIITAGGAGGMVMTNDPKLKDKALTLRDWGRVGNNSEDFSERFAYKVDGIEYDFKFLYGELGFNLKATEMQAAFALVQMKKLANFFKIRRANFDRYLQNLKGSSYFLPIEQGKQDWLAFPLMHEKRTKILNALESADIQTRVLFAGNITRHPAFRFYLQEFEQADKIMKEGFLVGCHQGMSFEDVDRVCEVLLKNE